MVTCGNMLNHHLDSGRNSKMHGNIYGKMYSNMW